MGSSDKTTTQQMEPFAPAQPYLKDALRGASDLYEQGGFSPSPFMGQRVADPSAATLQSQGMVMDQSGMPGASQQAQGALANMLSPGFANDQLAAASDYALSRAIPAAAAQFSGAGMTNSSQAMDTVARAATEATAPYAYDAMNQQQQNIARAAALSPQIDQAAYMPAQMMGQVGAQQNALSQARLNAQMQQFVEEQGQPIGNLTNFANLASQIGGMGGQTSVTEPGASTGSKLLGAGLTGLGTYGALTGPAAMGGLALGGPIGLAGGLAAGMLGLL